MDSSLPINQGIVNKNYDQTGFYSIRVLEMQQYIDISSYRDTLGSDTVSIHI